MSPCKMKSSHHVCQMPDSKTKSCLYSLVIGASLICGVYFTGSALLAKDYRTSPRFGINGTELNSPADNCQLFQRFEVEVDNMRGDTQPNKCMGKCRPPGSEALPEGILVKSSNLEMRPLWGSVPKKKLSSSNLLALSVGIKQKELVNNIVRKFLENGFVVMLFHYDNVVDEWRDLEWNSRVIHVSAANQTKWWFAKRFLHPDIVAEYEYIFLWDEDLGVENFNPQRYLSIVKEEDLEISQPALDPGNSEVHHLITARNRRSRVHRSKGIGRCKENVNGPPCAGWVEMMAPVFSKAAWRCAWYMIQNDLIHAWGLDFQLGYCAQGNRARKVGVVDAEYVVHMGLPTLGGLSGEHKLTDELDDHFPTMKNAETTPLPKSFDKRLAVRKQSYIEMRIFRNRWRDAVKNDRCWIDPYQQTAELKIH